VRVASKKEQKHFLRRNPDSVEGKVIEPESERPKGKVSISLPPYAFFVSCHNSVTTVGVAAKVDFFCGGVTTIVG
jgi:hypothetical protein